MALCCGHGEFDVAKTCCFGSYVTFSLYWSLGTVYLSFFFFERVVSIIEEDKK